MTPAPKEWRFSLDARGEYVLDFDAAFAELARGVTRSTTYIGQPIAELFGARIGDVLSAGVARARESGTYPSLVHGWGDDQQHFRVEIRFAPEEPRFDVALYPMQSADGVDPSGLLSDALRQNVTEMIAVFDEHLRILAFNAPYAAGAAFLLGRPLVIGDTMRDLMAPGTMATWDALYARALRGESLVEDVSFVFSVGIRRTYEVSLNPVRDDAGVPRGALMISRNVTVRRDEAEAARRAAESRHAILAAMPEAITVFDRAGNIVEFKGASDVPIPMLREELIGKNLRDMTHVPVDRILALLERAFAEPSVTHHLDYEAMVGGVPRSREASLRAIGPDEAVWIVRDVSDRRESARRLAFADRMASLGTLAAGVAHELNNPLSYVTANLEYLADMLTGEAPLNDEGRAALADAVQGLERMRGIVASLRSFSHPQEDSGATADLASVVTGAVKLAAREISTRARLDIDLGLRVHVSGSESRLSQVFLNLLLNAAQALDPTRAAVNVVRVRLSKHADGRAMVEVADNGAGIPAEIRERVFDPFFTTKPVGEGTGLGLAIAQQIVRGCGGEIELDASEGAGATFRVLLPLVAASPASPSPSPSAPRPSAHRGAHLLVVDDDPAVRSGLSRLLSDWRLTIVSSARAAMTALEVDVFDLVLCDVMMPGTTGIDFYLDVSARWPGKERKVVLMTGGLLAGEYRGALGAKAPTILNKPFDTASVERCLDEVKRNNG